MTIQSLLTAALDKRAALGLPSETTTAYRLVHGEADGLEGLTVDVYDRYLVASLYRESYGLEEQGWVEALGQLGFDGVYLKRRPKQANEVAEAERKERAPEHAVVGRDAPDELVVHEHGVPYQVRLGDGFSTGLFLDQRDNRGRLSDMAAGKSVLNLFAYTCGFGLAAAVAGARRTVNIDVSKVVLERGRNNYQLSGLSREGAAQGSSQAAEEHLFLARDVFETLPKLARKEERFDLVVLDPPSYASTKRGRFSVERDYTELSAIALQLVAEGGSLLACLNHHKLGEGDLSRALSLAGTRVSRRFRELTLVPPPRDHEPPAGRVPHLKSAWIRL
jgi:23S rRNA (cytosine1962-C5)-methyltransferase